MPVKNEQLINNINDRLIDLRTAITRKEIHGNKNPNKIVHIVYKILHFIKQQKGKVCLMRLRFERYFSHHWAT